MRALADSHDDVSFGPAELARIRARTLVVYGDRDPLYPVEHGVELYRGIPNASLWVVPGGGHVPIARRERRAEFVAPGAHCHPPVEWMICPVTQRASSVASHAITRAASSGWPQRPCGARSSTSR